MPRLNFATQFAEPIHTGQKTQTIRAHRKQPIAKGDRLHLFTGMRTKHCEKIGVVTCTFAGEIFISTPVVAVKIDGRLLDDAEVHELALADGFTSVGAFVEFFCSDPPEPYEIGEFGGQLIKWQWGGN